MQKWEQFVDKETAGHHLSEALRASEDYIRFMPIADQKLGYLGPIANTETIAHVQE